MVAAARAAPPPHTMVVETGPLRIDRIYTSMAGPGQRVGLNPAELDWVTAFRTEVVRVDGGKPMGEEFFCHAQLQLSNAKRLMVTATGTSELRFPEGFAVPVTRIMSSEGGGSPDTGGVPVDLTFFGMALNNHEPSIDVQAKVRATVEYWRAGEVGDPPRLKSLYRTELNMVVADIKEYTPSDPSADVATHCALVDGRIQHWLVPPGRQKTRKRATWPFTDATVHYATVHLHNHGVYMRLTDVTTGKILWQTNAEYERERRQIVRIPEYSSRKGFQLRKGREYEIEAYYDNTTDRDVDAMAMMALFYHPADEN